MSDILIQYISKDNLNQYNEQTISYIKGYVTNQINNVTTIVATQIKNINDNISNDIVTKLTSHINNTEIHMTETKNSNLATAYNHSQSSHARVDATKTSVTRTLNSGIKIGNITINDSTSVDLYAPAVVDNLTSTDRDKSLSANMGNKLNTEISELKKYVSDSKSNVASAITSMGVNTASDATFDTIVTNIKAISANTTAEAGHILDGKIVYLKGKYVTGNMPNRGNLSKSINAGSYVDIPAGYYSGGKITATGLDGQTTGTAAATDILAGKTAWVNGTKITGTMANNGDLTKSLSAGGSLTISAGYYSGGKITANSLSSQTTATATADTVLYDKTAWVNGTKITGTMANNGAVTSSLNCGDSYTIPAGYHNGSGEITANSLSSQTSATAAAGHILSGKTAWVNGVKITGTMDNKGTFTKTLSPGDNVSLYGYYASGSMVNTYTLSNLTSATATADTVLYNKTAWVNGSKITGSIKNATIFLPYQIHSTTSSSSSFIDYKISSNEDSKNYSIGTTYFTLTNVYNYNIKIAANNNVIFDFDLNKIDTIKSGTFSLIIDGYGSIPIPSTGTNHNPINVNNKLYIEATYTSKVLSIQIANRTSNFITISYLYIVAYLTDSTNQLTDLYTNMSRGTTATAADIISGETAWINGTKITGTMKKISILAIGKSYLTNMIRNKYINELIISNPYNYDMKAKTGNYTINQADNIDYTIIDATNSYNNGYIAVLVASSTTNASKYDKIIVNYECSSKALDGSDNRNFRGYFGIVNSDYSGINTEGEGSGGMIRYSFYRAESTSSTQGTVDIDISSITSTVRFAVSLVHRGTLQINSVTWVKED